jgi:hypothetical protein
MPTMARKSSGPRNVTGTVQARQAAEAAFDYFHSLFSNFAHQVSDPSLEEVEISKDGRFWLVTLGFTQARPKNMNLPEFLHVPLRKLKVFKVDAFTGKVLSMKIPHEE